MLQMMPIGILLALNGRKSPELQLQFRAFSAVES
jgi:hypothetical protein